MNPVTSLVKSELLIFSIILDVVLIIYLRYQESRNSFSLRLLVKILIAITLVSLSEAVTFLTGEPGNSAQIPLHYWSNVVYLATVPLPGSLGLTYLDYKLFGIEEQSRKRFYFYLIPCFLSTGQTIANFFAPGYQFLITDMNVYQRGPGLYIQLIFMWVFLALVIIYFQRFRSLVAGRLIQAIIIFSLTPAVGSVIQMLAQGTTFTMPFYTLGAFCTFLILERDEMAKDPLTRLYTRKNLESRIRFKIKSGEPFSFVLIDLNDFKLINDNYGHLEGDKVLNIVSRVLVECTKIEDMVCRYGGDEFCLLLEYKDDIRDKIIGRIENELNRYSDRIEEYDITASFGYVYVESPTETSLEQLIAEADKRMYKDKMIRKAQRK